MFNVEYMTRSEQLDFLIDTLSPSSSIPQSVEDKWQLFRSLINVREPMPVSENFLAVQDELLQALIAEKGITDSSDLMPIQESIYLWRGDITALKVDAIVNAANSGMLGCFLPCHSCIDNVIHTYAGVQLRLECAAIMNKQGYPEPTGSAKITAAYNLPSKYILHTVGPMISDKVRNNDKESLASCYRSCLALAEQSEIESIAFCCISTGVFRFPQEQAAQIAIETVSDFIKNSNHVKRVVFNVFTETDELNYGSLLQ